MRAAISIGTNRLSHAAASQTLAERLTRKARKNPRNNTFITLKQSSAYSKNPTRIRHLCFVILPSFKIRHSAFAPEPLK
jgi:hypothetical protein